MTVQELLNNFSTIKQTSETQKDLRISIIKFLAVNFPTITGWEKAHALWLEYLRTGKISSPKVQEVK